MLEFEQRCLFVRMEPHPMQCDLPGGDERVSDHDLHTVSWIEKELVLPLSETKSSMADHRLAKRFS